MRYLALRIVCQVFEFLTRFLVRPLKTDSQNRKMLSWFLEWDRVQRQHWIATFSFPLFGGVHPKNVFATRIEDLREQVESFSASPVRVLDFGCGSGRTLELLAPKLFAGLGIDLRAPERGQHAEIGRKFPQIQFEYAEHTPASLKKRAAEFKPDLVVLSHVLEHIENPVDFLKALYPFPILVCLPSEESWIQILRKNLGLSNSTDSTHFREYTRASVRKEMSEAGYFAKNIQFNSEGELVFLALPKTH